MEKETELEVFFMTLSAARGVGPVVGRGIQRRSMWGAGLPWRQQRSDGGMADLLLKPLRCGQEKIPRPRSFAFRWFLDKVLI